MPSTKTRRVKGVKLPAVLLALFVTMIGTPSAAHADFWQAIWDNFNLCGGAVVNCFFFGTDCDSACFPWPRACPGGCWAGVARTRSRGWCEWEASRTGSCGYSEYAIGRCYTCEGRPVYPLGYEALAPDPDEPVLLGASPSTFLRTDETITLRFGESMDPNFVVLGGELGLEADPDYGWSRGGHFNSDLTLRPRTAWTPAQVSTLTVMVRDANQNEADLELRYRVRDPDFFDQAGRIIDGKAASLGIDPGVISQAPLVPVAVGFKKDFTDGLSVYLKDGATEAFEVHGAIHARYLASGGPAGPLGFPTSDELATGPFGVNRISHFECGTVWWLVFPGTTGVDLVPGCVP